MAAPFKSMGKKRALLIAIRSVVGDEYSDLPRLAFAHRDARELRDHLTNSYGYHPDDIILMLDDKDHPEHLWPTRHRILHQIDQLTHDAPEDGRFFFYFSGHGLEEECRERTCMRADGQDDEILCADGKPILDYILHKRLITPLEQVKGSTLVALFDCCHSETLLDLQWGNGPNQYSRVWNVGPDQLFKALSISIVGMLQLIKKHARNDSLRIPRRKSTFWHNEPTLTTREVKNLSVICLSACRDGQLAHDDCQRQLTFTKCFMDSMAGKPDLTWTELRDALKHLISDIRTRYEHVYWVQEPRISTNSYTDLTQVVTQTL